jgi:hypothetical protein
MIRGCYFECTSNSGSAVRVETGCNVRVEDTTFISTATSPPTRPASAITVVAAAVVQDVVLSGCVFDGGVKGFSGYAAEFSTTIGATSKRIRMESTSIVRGASLGMNSGVTGHVQASTVNGGSRLTW